MKRLIHPLIVFVGFALLSACGGGGGGGDGSSDNANTGDNDAQTALTGTYSMSITGVTASNTSNQVDASVSGLPIAGDAITGQ